MGKGIREVHLGEIFVAQEKGRPFKLEEEVTFEGHSFIEGKEDIIPRAKAVKKAVEYGQEKGYDVMLRNVDWAEGLIIRTAHVGFGYYNNPEN
jgi:hypothetical protein